MRLVQIQEAQASQNGQVATSPQDRQAIYFFTSPFSLCKYYDTEIGTENDQILSLV